MMIAWTLFKKLAPIIAILLSAAGVWWHGYVTADNRCVKREAQIQAESAQLLRAANERTADVEKTLSAAARVIDANSQQDQTEKDRAAADNRTALAERLRRESARGRCGAVPDHSAAAESRSNGDSAAWVVSDAVAERLIQRHDIAEQVAITARACQAYIKQIEEIANVGRSH